MQDSGQHKQRAAIAGLLVLVLRVTALGADRYWIGTNSVNWNSAANWSTNSGGAGGASVPGASDIAIFDTNSPACTINADASVAGLMLASNFVSALTQGSGYTVTVGSSGFAQSNGVFVGSNANITFNALATFAGGAFTNTSGILNARANFTNVTDTTVFYHNGGKTQFTPQWNGKPAITPGSFVFRDVEFRSNGDNCRYDINGTMIVTNDLSFSDVGGYAAGGLAGGFINLYGNVRMQTDLWSRSGGTTHIRLVGTGDQSIVVDGLGHFPGFEINKPSGKVVLAGSKNEIFVGDDWLWTSADGLVCSNKTLHHYTDYRKFQTATPGPYTYDHVTFSFCETSGKDITGTYRIAGNMTMFWREFSGGGVSEWRRIGHRRQRQHHGHEHDGWHVAAGAERHRRPACGGHWRDHSGIGIGHR